MQSKIWKQTEFNHRNMWWRKLTCISYLHRPDSLVMGMEKGVQNSYILKKVRFTPKLHQSRVVTTGDSGNYEIRTHFAGSDDLLLVFAKCGTTPNGWNRARPMHRPTADNTPLKFESMFFRWTDLIVRGNHQNFAKDYFTKFFPFLIYSATHVMPSFCGKSTAPTLLQGIRKLYLTMSIIQFFSRKAIVHLAPWLFLTKWFLKLSLQAQKASHCVSKQQ